MSLSRALHAEITRRAEGWRDHVAQGTAEERHVRTGRAANDIALWLRLAAELGWSEALHALPQIEIRGDLARALKDVNQADPLRDGEDWLAARRSIDQSLARVRAAAADDNRALPRWQDLRTIDHHFTAAEQAFHARAEAATPEPRKDAA